MRVWLEESELSESVGFGGSFESTLYLVEVGFVLRETGDSCYCILFNDRRRMVGFSFGPEGFVVRLSIQVVGSVR